MEEAARRAHLFLDILQPVGVAGNALQEAETGDKALLDADDALCRLAADSNEPDFEDAIIRASAEDARVDFILTRDAQAFQHSPLRALTAEKYLELFG